MNWPADICGRPSATPTTQPTTSTKRCWKLSPGDIVFSFVDTRVVAIGIAQSYCWESPKPTEFGIAGQNWANVVLVLHDEDCLLPPERVWRGRLAGRGRRLASRQIDPEGAPFAYLAVHSDSATALLHDAVDR